MTQREEARIKAGDRTIYEVESLLVSGEGTCGRARVAGAFPGERVEARIEHVGKHATFATALRVERGREARRDPPCLRHWQVAGRCSGCMLMSLEEKDQRELLRQMLTDQFGLHVDSVQAGSTSLGYRWSAKRIAFGGPGNLRLGSFIRGSHHPANMENCLVDHPLIAAAADEVADVARRLSVAAHDERTGSQGLRAVWLRTDGKLVLTTLVTSYCDEQTMRQFASELKLSSGVAWSVNRDLGNALRGNQAITLCGVENLDVFGTSIGPMGFLQPNPVVAEMMYDWLIEGIGGGCIFDLFAGAGATTKRLRQCAETVVACESDPEAARGLGIEPEKAEAFLARQSRTPDAIVANPPRKGLGKIVCEEILRLAPKRVHVMACGPRGLKSDLGALEKGYQLESLRAFDTLPQTPHVELIAKFSRRRVE